MQTGSDVGTKVYRDPQRGNLSTRHPSTQTFQHKLGAASNCIEVKEAEMEEVEMEEVEMEEAERKQAEIDCQCKDKPVCKQSQGQSKSQCCQHNVSPPAR